MLILHSDALISGLPRTCISEINKKQGTNQFQIYFFAVVAPLVVRTKKTNPMKITKQYLL